MEWKYSADMMKSILKTLIIFSLIQSPFAFSVQILNPETGEVYSEVYDDELESENLFYDDYPEPLFVPAVAGTIASIAISCLSIFVTLWLHRDNVKNQEECKNENRMERDLNRELLTKNCSDSIVQDRIKELRKNEETMRTIRHGARDRILQMCVFEKYKDTCYQWKRDCLHHSRVVEMCFTWGDPYLEEYSCWKNKRVFD